MASKKLFGWVKPSPSQFLSVAKTLSMPIFSDVQDTIKGSGAGKVVVLSDYVKKLVGKHIAQIQAIGDCVSFGAAHAVDHTYCTEIIVKGDREEWVSMTSTEDIYGGSRVNIGNGQLGGSDGSFGIWAAKYVNQFGTLVRQRYQNDDLSKYDSNRARVWGNPGQGTPNYLLDIARSYKIRTVSLIQTYEEARDAIANGYAITIASNQGFGSTRDKDGFLSPRGSWPHQMCLIGVDDSYSRKACLCLNSWPYNWVSGPTRHDMPPGSFWIDANVLEERILSQGDSWAFSDKEGFPIKKLNLRIV